VRIRCSSGREKVGAGWAADGDDDLGARGHRPSGDRGELPRTALRNRGQRNAGATGQRVKRGISRKRVEEVIANKGKLTRWEMLRCRVRSFCDGAVLGTKDFVNGIFEHERHRFGPKRQTGAHPLRHVAADGPMTLRNLRLKPLG